jgi:nucleoside-diphosphate-sugar epimerase
MLAISLSKPNVHLIVTGASGFVGRVLIQSLARAGSTGLAVARRPIVDLPAGWRYQSRAELLQASPEVGVDAVIHLEARHHQYVAGNGSAVEVAAFTETNVENTREWLDWATRAGTERFVYFSSVKAVDPGWAPNRLGALDETTPGPGPSLYGRTKWQAEQVVAAWAKAPNRGALILRPAVIYGPGNTANIYSMVDAIARRRFVFAGANDNIKSIVSVRNATAATVHLLGRLKPGCEIYHLVDARRYSVRALAVIIARHLNVSAPQLQLPVALLRRAARMSDRLASATGLHLPFSSARLDALCEHADFSPGKLLATGFIHPETPEEGLREMVNWYRAAAVGRRVQAP